MFGTCPLKTIGLQNTVSDSLLFSYWPGHWHPRGSQWEEDWNIMIYTSEWKHLLLFLLYCCTVRSSTFCCIIKANQSFHFHITLF